VFACQGNSEQCDTTEANKQLGFGINKKEKKKTNH